MKKLFFAVIILSAIFSSLSAGAVDGKIYLACPSNYFGFMGFSDKWELTSEDGNLYTGTFTIPADKLDFYIEDYSGEGNYTIYGSSAREGSRVYFTFQNSEDEYSASLECAGQGDWAFEDWPGGQLTFSIDLGEEPPVVTVSTTVNPETGEETNSVVEIISGTPEDAVYNLQGIKVDKENLSQGFYIKNKKIIRYQ